MKDEIKYTDELMEIGEEVNILPSPEELQEDLKALVDAQAKEDPTKRKSLEEVMKSQGIEI
jgi:hypothetical protein